MSKCARIARGTHRYGGSRTEITDHRPTIPYLENHARQIQNTPRITRGKSNMIRRNPRIRFRLPHWSPCQDCVHLTKQDEADYYPSPVYLAYYSTKLGLHDRKDLVNSMKNERMNGDNHAKTRTQVFVHRG